jgi:hypothetical protein
MAEIPPREITPSQDQMADSMPLRVSRTNTEPLPEASLVVGLLPQPSYVLAETNLAPR